MAGIDNNTLALLHFDNVNAIDALGNKFVTDGLPQISRGQAKLSEASLYINGSSFVNFSEFTFDTTRDFTISYYEYLVSAPDSSSSITFNCSASSSGGLAMHHYQGNVLVYAGSGPTAGFDLIYGGQLCTVSETLNKWVHWEVGYTDADKKLYIFKDGVPVYTKTLASRIGNVNSGFQYIGAHPAGGRLTAYYDNVRVLSGVCDHTTVFTPPTQLYTKTANTVMLLTFKEFVYSDEVSVNKWSVYGLPLAKNFNKFDKSLYLDGNSYLSMPHDDKFNFSTGDFTIDWWEYRTTSNEAPVFTMQSSELGNCLIVGMCESGNITYFMSSSGSSWDIASMVTMGSAILNTWTHYALVRAGSSVMAFQNGVLKSTTTTTLPLFSATKNLQIGRDYTKNFTGYLDELRVSKGARWRSTFTPPTFPYSKVYFLAKTADNTYHAFSNSAWTNLGVAGDDASLKNLFLSNGVLDCYSAADLNQLSTSSVVKLCTYQETADGSSLTNTVNAVPNNQFVVDKHDVDLKGVSYVDWVHVNDGTTNFEVGTGKLRLIASRDSGKTWYVFDATSSAWKVVLDSTVAADGALDANGTFVPTTAGVQKVQSGGMSTTVFNAAPWNDFTVSAGFKVLRVAYLLATGATGDATLVDNVRYKYDGVGDWMLATANIHYTVKTRNSSHAVTWMTPIDSKRVKINY